MPIFLKDRKRNPWRGKVKRAGFKRESGSYESGH